MRAVLPLILIAAALAVWELATTAPGVWDGRMLIAVCLLAVAASLIIVRGGKRA